MKNKQKNGVALIWALILSSILLIVSGTMVSYITKEAQFGFQIGESTRVYSAAKAGITWASKKVEENRDNINNTPVTLSLDEIDITVVIMPASSGLCDSGTGSIDYCISSEASADGKITRKIFVKKRKTDRDDTLDSYESILANPASPQITDGGENSFSINFEFWGTPLPPTTTIPFGFQNETRNTKLYIEFNEDEAELVAEYWDPNSGAFESLRSSTSINTAPESGSTTYSFIADLSYIDDTTAVLSIIARDSGLKKVSPCRGEISLDLSGIDMGNLNYIYTSSDITSGSGLGGGDDKVFDVGGQGLYLDTLTTVGLTIAAWSPLPPPPTQYELSAISDPVGAVTSFTGTGFYNAGESVLIAAVYDSNLYTFSSWGEDCTGTTSSTTVRMDTNKSCTANLSSISPIWLTGPVDGIQVYHQDSGLATWNDATDTKCPALGGRLPTSVELLDIYNNQSSYGTFFTDGTSYAKYWVSDSFYVNYSPYIVNFTNGILSYTAPFYSRNIRCVK